MAWSSSTGEEPPVSSMVAEAPPLVSMQAEMIVATGHDHCQQLKDVLSKEDPSSMVVVMTSGNKTSTPKPPCSTPFMDPGLLAVACSGSWKKLHSFIKGDPAEARPTSSDGTTGSSAIQQPSRDQEALVRESFLDGVTAEGDTFLHVMATDSVVGGKDLIQADSLGLIHRKALEFLSRPNNNGDTPLHCAARAAKSQMVSFLVDLARGNNDANNNTVKALLEKQNNRKWTALHEAVRVGNKDMVTLLMKEDPELAIIPEDGTSPMYLAILMEHKDVAETLHEMSCGVLSYSGPDGQNALHAAVLRGKDLTKMLLGWNSALTIQQDKDGRTPLYLAASVLAQGGRPVHRERRAIHLLLLEANPDQLYQPGKDGLFPIHMAASVDAKLAISDLLNKSPGCAGLRDARGRTFLHVAVDQMKIGTVMSACTNQSLSWILNMQDNDGNTALHLAVKTGDLTMFCSLFGNRQVHLSITNEQWITPLDIAHFNLSTEGLYFKQSSEVKIHQTLKTAGAKSGIGRDPYLQPKEIVQAKLDAIDKRERMNESTQNLSVGSVLIATVTFGATFAMPGGYRGDDHTNGGTPTLAGRYAFDAFIVANALAFMSSLTATVSLISAGSPVYSFRSRVVNYLRAFPTTYFSVTCLVASFALATYIMLAPVAHTAAITICVLSTFVLLSQEVELAKQNAILHSAKFGRRMGNKIVLILPVAVLSYVGTILLNLWPIVVIFGLSALKIIVRKVEPATHPPHH